MPNTELNYKSSIRGCARTKLMMKASFKIILLFIKVKKNGKITQYLSINKDFPKYILKQLILSSKYQQYKD